MLGKEVRTYLDGTDDIRSLLYLDLSSMMMMMIIFFLTFLSLDSWDQVPMQLSMNAQTGYENFPCVLGRQTLPLTCISTPSHYFPHTGNEQEGGSKSSRSGQVDTRRRRSIEGRSVDITRDETWPHCPALWFLPRLSQVLPCVGNLPGRRVVWSYCWEGNWHEIFPVRLPL